MKKELNYKLIIIIITTTIVVLGLGTYFFIGWKSYKIREAQLKIDQTKQQNELDQEQKTDKEKIMNKIYLDGCLSIAEGSHADFWNSECATLGLGEDCKLPTWNANRVDENRDKDKAECFKKYPTK